MKRRSTGVAAWGLAVVLASGCSTFSAVKHPELKARQPRVHKLTVPPPQVEVYRITFKGGQELNGEQTALAQQWVDAELEKALIERGYSVPAAPVEDIGPEDLEAFQRNLLLVQDGFNKRITEHRKRLFGGFRKFRYSVGAPASVVTDYTGTDAIFVLRFQGFKKSKGEIAKDVTQSVLLAIATFGNATIIQRTAGIMLQGGIIDGETGEILWYAHNMLDPKGDPGNEKHVRKAIRQLVKSFPKAAH